MAGKVQRIWLLELTLIRDEFAELLSTLLAAMGRRNNHNQFPSAALVSLPAGSERVNAPFMDVAV